MSTSVIKKLSCADLIALGLMVTISSNLQAAVVTYTPATPVGVPLAQFEGNLNPGNRAFYSSSLPIPLAGGPYPGTAQPVVIDVNGDGTDDLTLFNEHYAYHDYSLIDWGTELESNDTYIDHYVSYATSTGSIFGDSALVEGDAIGPDSSAWTNLALGWLETYSNEWCLDFGSGWNCSYTNEGDLKGSFWGFTDNWLGDYLGFSFLIDGAEHFGWVNIGMSGYSPHTMDIYGWGWETDPGVSIAAGAAPIPVPAAAWLFGSGLLGLVGVARRRKAT